MRRFVVFIAMLSTFGCASHTADSKETVHANSKLTSATARESFRLDWRRSFHPRIVVRVERVSPLDKNPPLHNGERIALKRDLGDYVSVAAQKTVGEEVIESKQFYLSYNWKEFVSAANSEVLWFAEPEIDPCSDTERVYSERHR